MKTQQLLSALSLTLLIGCAHAQAPVTLTLDAPQTAGIAGFRGLWDTPIPLSENGAVAYTDKEVKDKHPTAIWAPDERKDQPGALAFDALQRAMLVRFPDAAQKIALQVNQGYAIQKVELVLPFRDTELYPPGDQNYPTPTGYLYRTNWGVRDLWLDNPPQWHAVAYLLKQPWQSDAQTGPTWNAYVNGGGFWDKYGAQGATDAFDKRFGPTEVSHQNTTGRMDVTSVLTDASFGATLEDRLSKLANAGFMVKKWETYDHRYFTGVYEWGTGVGGRGILVKTPKLVVTFAPGQTPKVDGDKATLDVKAFAGKLIAKPDGKPTAVMPTAAELEVLNKKYAAKPDWMAQWQWEQVKQLEQLDGDGAQQPFWYQYVDEGYIKNRLSSKERTPKGVVALPPSPATVYAGWVDAIIARQPRGWYGFEAAKEMAQWYEHGAALPGPARDAIKSYWTAWLMPDREAAANHQLRMSETYFDGPLVHPMADQLAGNKGTDKSVSDSYFLKTGDWRGNKSFYRSGFNYTISTQNFNTTASTGALLGGAIIGSENAMKDGRKGFQDYPLSQWGWSGGHTQENIDHYYYAITLSGQKAVADYGPTVYDRLMGQSALAKSIEEMTSVYHPGLKRFITGSSRTSQEYLLATMDGLDYIMHTVAPQSALHDVGNQKLPPGIKAMGHEVPADRIARQTLSGPWAPAWMKNAIDNKPLPFEAITSNGGRWQKNYLGENYGLASTDLQDKRINIMGQWRRAATPVERMQEMVTMDVRYGVNDTNWLNDAAGWIAPLGAEAALQHQNKMIVVTSPYDNVHIQNAAKKSGGLKSLQSSIGLFNFQENKSWEIYVDGQKITQLPHVTKAGARITIRDGVSYLGVTALAASDLGRADEVVLREGNEQEYAKTKIKAALVIDAYNLQSATPIDQPDWKKYSEAYGGFAIEMGDEAQYKTFAAFQKQIADAKLETRYDDAKKTVSVTYRSGKDTLETAVRTDIDKDEPNQVFVERKVNGAWPYLAEGLERDTALSQQGRNGRLSKNGAVLISEPTRLSFLQTEPMGETFTGWNPLPNSSLFSLALPGDVAVRADGRIGLTRVMVEPKAGKVWIDHGFQPGADETKFGDDIASAFLLTGFAKTPEVWLNGALVKPESQTVNGQQTFVVPLRQTVRSAAQMSAMLKKIEVAFGPKEWADPQKLFLLDWNFLGPFAANAAKDYGPEADLRNGGIDLKKSYGATQWQHKRVWNSTRGGPRTLEGLFSASGNSAHIQSPDAATYYGTATLFAERPQTIGINTWINSERDAQMQLWVNGEKTDLSGRGGRVAVALKAGENSVLLKITQGKTSKGGETLYFRVGDETFGLPIVEGVSFLVDGKKVPVN